MSKCTIIQSLSMWYNNEDWIKIEVNYIIEEKVIIEIEISELYCRKQSTYRILSIIFISIGDWI